MAEPIGYITETIGSVFAESDGQIRELAAGSPVYEGDVLVTADGQAEVEFRDDSQLSIGENTRMGLDEYVYQEDNSASNMFFSLVQGVFRAITGKIADNNPDGVNMETPLALIGIRGTTLGANYDPDSESGSVYSEEVEPGRSIIVTDSFGRVVVINFSGGAVDLQMGLPMSDVRFATPDELSSLRSLAPFTDAGGDQGRSASGADQEGGEQGDGQQGDEEPAATEEPADGDEIQSDMVVVDMQGEMTAEMESLFKPGQLQVALAVDDITELFPQLAPRVQQTEPENENHTPVANTETVVTEEDQTISGKVSASDPDGDQLSFALLQGPQNGSASMDSDGTYIYTPDPEFSGEDTFTYVVTDSQGGKGTGSVTVTVAATNDPPVAENMQVTTAYEESAAGAIAASDPDGDALVFSLDSAPGNGQVVVAPNGEFTYQPNAGYSGTDSFTVLVTDSEGAETAATVTVTVQEPLNQPPDAQNATVSIDSGENLLGQLVATDPDGDALTFALNAGPAHGSVFINPDGSFSYTPNAGYSGSDTFSYTVDDGKGGTDTATVTISVVDVNEPPVGQNMSFSVDEGGSLSGVLAASDPDGDALTFSLFSGPQNGNVTVNANGTFSYTPAADFVGVDSFVYLVNDGNGGTDTATVQISVAGELNEPAISINNATAEEAGGAMVFTLALTHQWDQTVTVNWSTADGTAVAGEDYIAASGTVSFSPGQTIATITVDIIDDALFEGAETLLVKLNNPQNGSLENTEGVGTILANDEPLPSVSIADAQAFESDGAMFFTVTLSQAADSEVTVLWSTQDGSALAGQDYEASSGQLVFAPGQTVATISVNLLDDAVLEESESFTVKLSAPSGAELGDAQAVGEIIDNDQALPAISIADAQAVEADGTMTFIVSLDAPTESPVSVDWTTADLSAAAGADYESASGTLTFEPGQTEAFITVTLLDDFEIEGDHSFEIVLTNPVNGTLADTMAIGTIIDDDDIPVASVSGGEALESEGSVAFSIFLDRPTSQEVVITWRIDDGSAVAGEDFVSTTGTAIFQPGTTELFTSVQLLDDAEVEGTETFSVVLETAEGATLGESVATLTILDDDTTQPTEGDDILYGTSEADFIDGLGGNDEIFGLEGADTLLGSGGNDFIYGDAGNDSLLGGLGDDVIHDDAGDDMVLGLRTVCISLL